MADIKAFVAHSFSAEDKDLIQVFIDHFNSLAGSLPGFSWDHALQAEPTSVSEKVLSKIEDKNVFIGICGRTECVAPPKATFQFPLFSLIGFRTGDVQWKTSDWIIQEIGLAVGRQMKVIIFLEEDVRKPGGLFGDVEYIPFTRKYPQASFDKLLQMLGTLMPKNVPTVADIEAKPATSDKPKDEDETEDSLEPQLSWGQDEYDQAAFRTILFRRDSAVFDKIDAAYRESPLSKGGALAIWEAMVEWSRMLADQKADFEKIKKAVKADPNNSQVYRYLANGYSWYGEHLLAAQAYESESEYGASELDKLRSLISAAREYALAQQKARSNEIVEKIKLKISDDLELTRSLLSYFKEQAELDKEEQFQLAVMEEIVALRPTDTAARFSLAYQHSQVGNHDMALYHYQKIPHFARDPTTWNNLGVSYGEFGMRIKSVEAFRLSEKENETLAMSNLGFKLLRAGFLAEAQQEADKAIAIKSYHANVPELIKRLKEAPKEEQDKLEETLDKVKAKADFYRKAADGVLKSSPTTIASSWNSPDGVLEAKMDGDFVRIFGSQQRSANALGGVIYPAAGGLGNLMTTHRVEYSGRVRGNVIFGEVKRSHDGAVQSLLAMGGGDSKVIMVFNEDQSQLHVIERLENTNPTFYVLTRSESK
jgi:tetratricopeptide (TPR) repeat protein